MAKKWLRNIRTSTNTKPSTSNTVPAINSQILVSSILFIIPNILKIQDNRCRACSGDSQKILQKEREEDYQFRFGVANGEKRRKEDPAASSTLVLGTLFVFFKAL